MDEYILKLQIHQHSLLTRKVLSQHNISEEVFFVVSSGSSSSYLCLQVIFIFKSSSSSDLDHHWTSPLDLDHHWASSLDLDHYSILIITARSSSLDLDHHWLLSLDLDHQGCYLMIFSSQEVLQSQPFFMLVIGLASMQVFFSTYI